MLRMLHNILWLELGVVVGGWCREREGRALRQLCGEMHSTHLALGCHLLVPAHSTG